MTSRYLHKFVLLAGCGLIAAAMDAPSRADSLPAGTAPAETVIVTAPKLDAATLDEAAPAFVEARTKLSPIHQVARWRAPLCPSTEGLPPAFNDFVSARMRAIAARVGAAAEKNCKPNVQVIFTADPQKAAEQVAEHSPWLFGMWYGTDALRIAKIDRPIEAFYVTASVESSGRQMTDHPDAPVGVTGSNRALYDSRLGQNRMSVFENVLIFADRAKISGYDVGAVADYISVLALSQVEPGDGCSGLPSIVDLLAEGCTGDRKPNSLTSVDEEFLKALYETDPRRAGLSARTNIARRMAAVLAGR
jgi:hypothetical protein